MTLTAKDFRLNTGASASQDLVSFVSVGAVVRIGTLELNGEARNFAFLGDGTFDARPGFGVFLGVGAATGDSFKWPSFLPVRIDSIGIQWDDIENDPGNFVLVLSASVTGIKGLSGLEFSGSVQGIRIAPALLAQGEFPIIGLDALSVHVKGTMFGGTIDAALLGGILKLDSDYRPIGALNTTTPVAHRVFYLGLQGGFSMAGMAGFTIRIGLSDLGPLQVFINVEVPGGILLEPTSGLTLNDFSAGVEFFKTLPSIDDPFALRSTAFGLPTNLTADEWLTSLQQQVADQAKAVGTGNQPNGFLAAFTSPMVITGSARIYSMYTSQAVFNGLVTIKISTDGKFLISGQLNFADNNLSLSGRLYADLSPGQQRQRDDPVPGRHPRPGPHPDALRQDQDGLQELLRPGGDLHGAQQRRRPVHRVRHPAGRRRRRPGRHRRLGRRQDPREAPRRAVRQALPGHRLQGGARRDRGLADRPRLHHRHPRHQGRQRRHRRQRRHARRPDGDDRHHRRVRGEVLRAEGARGHRRRQGAAAGVLRPDDRGRRRGGACSTRPG